MSVHDVVEARIAHEVRPWVAKTVRLGYAAKGIVFLLIGVLAFRLGAGLDGGRLLNPDGALRVVVRQPFGVALVTAIAVGILAYCIWQFVEGICDTRHKGHSWKALIDRAVTVFKGAAYGTVGWQAISLLRGRSSSQNPDRAAAGLIALPLGDLVLFALGVGVAIYGMFELRQTLQRRFDEDVDSRRMRAEAGRWAVTVGLLGNGARGVILTTMGGACAVAALTHDPSKAAGIADALRILVAEPLGIYFLTIAGAGLACYGVFELLHARYARL